MNNELAPNILISSQLDGTVINEHYLISALLWINNKLTFNENYLLQLELKQFLPFYAPQNNNKYKCCYPQLIINMLKEISKMIGLNYGRILQTTLTAPIIFLYPRLLAIGRQISLSSLCMSSIMLCLNWKLRGDNWKPKGEGLSMLQAKYWSDLRWEWRSVGGCIRQSQPLFEASGQCGGVTVGRV